MTTEHDSVLIINDTNNLLGMIAINFNNQSGGDGRFFLSKSMRTVQKQGLKASSKYANLMSIHAKERCS